jgi:hypothetical protein
MSTSPSPSQSPQQQQQQQQQHPPLPPALQHLAAHDLATGTGGYANLQPVLRQTFAALLDAAAASHAQVAALEERVARQEARRREEGEASAVAFRTVRTLLDGHVEALRAEFAPRIKGLEERVAAAEREVGRDRDGGGGARMVEAALTRRVELLQGELVRLARALDSKADGAEVEAALRLRVSKASLPKRLESILLHGVGGEEGKAKGGGGGGEVGKSQPQPKPLLAGLKRRVEVVEVKLAEQEKTVRRLGREVEAVRVHVVGGGKGNGGGGGGQPPQEGIAGVLRGMQTVLEQQGRRVQRAEKEVVGLKEKVVRELALVEGRVGERLRAGGEVGGRPVVAESLKAFEQEIVKVCVCGDTRGGKRVGDPPPSRLLTDLPHAPRLRVSTRLTIHPQTGARRARRGAAAAAGRHAGPHARGK